MRVKPSDCDGCCTGLHYHDVFVVAAHHSPRPIPSRPELCPQDVPVKCSATYTVTQADVDSGKRSNTASVKSTSPDGATTSDDDEETVLVLGSAGVTIGEACI